MSEDKKVKGKKPKLAEFIPYFLKEDDSLDLIERKFNTFKKIKQKLDKKNNRSSFWEMMTNNKSAWFNFSDFWVLVVGNQKPQIHIFFSKASDFIRK